MVDTPRAHSDKATSGEVDGGVDSLYCLSYVSTERSPLSNDDLEALLHQAREKNARLGITGILLHRGGSFFQILEGGPDEVRELYKSISEDSRHQRVEVVSEGPVDSREYSDWQMAFVELDGQDFSALPGFSDILKNTPAAREFLAGLSRSKKLAMLFTILE